VNNYVRLNRAKAELGLDSVATQDAALVRTIASVSRAFDRYLSPRFFYAKTATVYFDGPGGVELWTQEAGDLLSVSTLKFDENGDGVYELSLTENTDFLLWPYNRSQKDRVDLAVNGSRSAFPSGQRRVELVGTFGYSEDLDAVGLTGTVADAATTTITASATAESAVYAGDTLKIESEQVYVTSVTGTGIVCVRGVNGTTAAAHSAKALYVRRYPDDIEHAVIMQLTRYRWDLQTGLGGAIGMTDGGAVSLWPQVKGILAGYDRVSPGLVL